MRLIKTFGLAATAVAAMAFIGATSASAINTQLCTANSGLTCGSGASSVSMVDTQPGVLLSDTVIITCDTIEGEAVPLALANPQPIHFTALAFESCSANNDDDCEVTVNQLPLADLNKTGLDAGTLTGLNGRVFVECQDFIFDVDIECEYDLAGFQLSASNQHLTANKAPLNEIGSDFACPNNPTFDGLLKTTESRYVLA